VRESERPSLHSSGYCSNRPPTHPLLDRIASAVVGSSCLPLVLGPIVHYRPVSTDTTKGFGPSLDIWRYQAIISGVGLSL